MSVSDGRWRAETLGHCLDKAAKRLTAAGIDSARLDARLLAARALGWDAGQVVARPDHTLTPEQGRILDALFGRREAREPMSIILGCVEFWSLDFTVTPDVLAPRPDSETLVEAVLAHVEDKDSTPTIVDFGTGSGCLLLALLHELSNARGVGVDISEAAIAVAEGNAQRLHLDGRARFQVSDWDAQVEGQFDLVIANPPYIAESDFLDIAPEVARFEPRLALSGGMDGLDCYRALAPALNRRLASQGRAFVEIGADQAETVADVLGNAGLVVKTVHQDLAGRSRVIEAGLGDS
ncbi:MAG: peptide chain release factor N(5)-glutamine methyltransferase [Rhodospirillales bacterium]|nr:peptide chain release factor N(5)-glutamine methyltransferase [Rhodospirillales bacterium]